MSSPELAVNLCKLVEERGTKALLDRLDDVLTVKTSDKSGWFDLRAAMASNGGGSRLIDQALKELEDGRKHEARAAAAAAQAELQPWADGLIPGDDGKPLANIANAAHVLRHHPDWTGVLVFDEFAYRTMLVKQPPFAGKPAPRHWTDMDDKRTAEWLQRLGLNVTPGTVTDAVEIVAHDQSVHPVRDYLDRLTWDGTPRIDTWLTDHMGAENMPYVRAVASKTLIKAVARIYEPGCQAKSMLVLEGPQDIGKSKTIRALASDQWFGDSLPPIHSKDVSTYMVGLWLIEMPEMAAMRKSDVADMKAFVSRQVERFRPPYGKREVERPRESILFGTENNCQFLRDSTGGVRFWPVTVTKADVEGVIAARDQLWAEAVVRYRRGETHWLDDATLAAAAREEQEARLVTDPWHEMIETWLSDKDRTTPLLVATKCLGIEPGRVDQRVDERVRSVLVTLGWIKRTARIDGVPNARAFVPGPTAIASADRRREEARQEAEAEARGKTAQKEALKNVVPFEGKKGGIPMTGAPVATFPASATTGTVADDCPF
jgi:predicted P-loop ATPase